MTGPQSAVVRCAWMVVLAWGACAAALDRNQPPAQRNASGPISTDASTPKPRTRLDELAEMSLDKLGELAKQGKEALGKIVKGDESDLDRSMRELQDTVCAAAERARRLSTWDIKQVEAEAEQAFDDTIAAIQSYLEFVKDDGPIHQASKRIRAAALEKERVFNEKSSSKNSDRYKDLATGMHVQAERASAAWEAIRKERGGTEEALGKLKESRELFIDVKAARGISAAVRELESVRDDLARLSQTMRKVQEAVLQEARRTADEGAKPPDAKPGR